MIRLTMLGAMLESHPGEGESPAIKGSMIVYTATTVEEVRELIKNDIYAKSGVWDVEKAQIIPVCCLSRAIRLPEMLMK